MTNPNSIRDILQVVKDRQDAAALIAHYVGRLPWWVRLLRPNAVAAAAVEGVLVDLRRHTVDLEEALSPYHVGRLNAQEEIIARLQGAAAILEGRHG